jgi:ParB-like chromosome segregation protein Spo0J
MYIPINRILVNKQITSEEHVDDFVEMIERGWKMPPITVRKATINDKVAHEYYVYIEGGLEYYVLVDGRHRLAAHKILGKETILAFVTL